MYSSQIPAIADDVGVFEFLDADRVLEVIGFMDGERALVRRVRAAVGVAAGGRVRGRAVVPIPRTVEVNMRAGMITDACNLRVGHTIRVNMLTKEGQQAVRICVHIAVDGMIAVSKLYIMDEALAISEAIETGGTQGVEVVGEAMDKRGVNITANFRLSAVSYHKAVGPQGAASDLF